MTHNKVYENNVAARAFDDVAANDPVNLVISAFHQYRRTHVLNQFERRVFLEHDDKIDGLERSKHLGATFRWIDGPPFAL